MSPHSQKEMNKHLNYIYINLNFSYGESNTKLPLYTQSK